MNQCPENPPDDEVPSVRVGLISSDAVESPLAAPNAADAGKWRVLMLEDDPVFRGIIRDFLIENGYTVVAVQNGGEGVREVLASDFALVLCDLMMPGLPGDMFYRAVERIRPPLCQRFIFMTGHQNDAGTNEFIKNINGVLLRKPFPLKNLLDLIAFAEVRSRGQSVCGGASGNPDVAADFQPADSFREGAAASSHASAAEGILAPAPAGQTSGVLPAKEPEPHAGGGSPAFVLAGFALVLVLVAGLWKPYWEARDRVAAAAVKRRALDSEWLAVSRDLQEAVAARPKIEVTQRQLAGVSADQAEPRWGPVLRSIVACAGQEIQLREIRARDKFGDAKMWTLLVGGVSTGSLPRTVADDFRSRLQRELDRTFQGGVSIQLERFEDLPGLPSVPLGDRRGAFTIGATIGLAGKTRPERKDGE